MKVNTLKRGVRVTELGLGAARFGNLYRETTDEEVQGAFEQAWSAGVRYYDTAPHYGLGLSERRLGALLQGKRRDEFTISTKVGKLLVANPGGDHRQDDQGFAVASPASQFRRIPASAGGLSRARPSSAHRVHELRGGLRRRPAGDGARRPGGHAADVDGTQKAMAELLINDYTRRGFVDGRSLRLPTICVRPGRPNAAASSFASGIIREPLNGETSRCPVSAATAMWLLSPRTAIECFIAAHDIDGAALGSNRLLNLPGMSITVGEMVAALGRVAGPDVVARILWEPDPLIAKMVATWPGKLEASRARQLGFPSDDNFDDIIRHYIADARIGAPQ